MARQVKKARVIAPALPHIPWQDRPAGCRDVVWRYDGNPVIRRDLLARSNSIFNSAVVPFGGGFAGVFRVDDTCRFSALHAGFSDDGITWRIEESPLAFATAPRELPWEYGYDPRVVALEGRYYVTWCNGIAGDPTIGLAWTKDFRRFHQLENITLPCNRNGVLFPRKIGGQYVLLSRPSDKGHTPFGDIYLSRSGDLTYWGRHRFVMGTAGGWQRTKIGPGPAPIETTAGWLLIYHGVHTSCNGMTYSCGAALLDRREPWKVLARTRPYVLNPRQPYELAGDVPNVVFPVAALADGDTGRLAIYYGAADTVTALAFCHAHELVDFIRANSLV